MNKPPPPLTQDIFGPNVWEPPLSTSPHYRYGPEDEVWMRPLGLGTIVHRCVTVFAVMDSTGLPVGYCHMNPNDYYSLGECRVVVTTNPDVPQYWNPADILGRHPARPTGVMYNVITVWSRLVVLNGNHHTVWVIDAPLVSSLRQSGWVAYAPDRMLVSLCRRPFEPPF